MRTKVNQSTADSWLRGVALVRGDEGGRAAVVEVRAGAEADVQAAALPLLRAKFERGETFEFDPPRATDPPAGYSFA